MTDLQQVIYIGPNNRKYGLLRNTVYEGGIPGNVSHAIAEVPEVALLIVPVQDMIMKIERSNRKGTPEYRACEVIAGVKI